MPTPTRERIINAAYDLLREGGREAVSTRAVSAAAGVQAPTIYRTFGDKQGLLDAVAMHGFSSYLAGKGALAQTDDPVDDLRAGWDLHVGFGVANPACYSLIYGEPRAGLASPAAVAAAEILAVQVNRIAVAGRLRVTEPRAAFMIHAAGCGTTLSLIALPADRRDPQLSVLAREAVIAGVTFPDGAAHGDSAVALRAVVGSSDVLTPGERALMTEWLDRFTTER
ncbi:TetR/AcrR family transcriptional regulator [Dactylosporangium matsuzakiense]|uniref:TetR family transcriptional regulator n=1 Tax=Dactylosporangium matsuzakiense TaxID=53360 RepID=A0A9W6NSU0_9ACTN|nr:TetR/AcrR family transcriptional regulator [Dactylosporangium matsuzakiense]UWZ48862.1 TetR/AcrR family transcriptional regulator [Dactylosporangium matsuzakiense]GLL08740.1 TetR family transcriptional regulator [Dactylosporangium matsuzakiense]